MYISNVDSKWLVYCKMVRIHTPKPQNLQVCSTILVYAVVMDIMGLIDWKALH